MTALLAIDPGTTHSGWVVVHDGAVIESGNSENHEVLSMLSWRYTLDIAIERFEARGMAIGDESVQTILWTGRFIQAASPRCVRLVKRSAVKSHLCGSQRAKDTHVRTALLDKFGPGKAEAVGTVKKPGPLYGVKSHAWAALAVAVTALETKP